MIVKTIKKYKLIFVILLAYIITGFYNIKIFQKALVSTLMYFKEMMEVLPAVFILTGLINVWVPPEIIMKNFGIESGLKGKITSLMVGAVSAGPIYAAFPLAQSLLLKGASIGNTVIILSSWAVIKIPMLLVESKFLGINFSAVRYLLTIPGIMLISVICEKVISRKEVIASVGKNYNVEIEKIEKMLPGLNCGSCGYKSCNDYASAIFKKDTKLDKCIPGGKEVTLKIRKLMQLSLENS